MDTIVCPVCGTLNPTYVMNCQQCRINLQFALQNPAEVERIKSERTGREIPRTDNYSMPRRKDSSLYPQVNLALSAISGWVAGLLETGILIFLANILDPYDTLVWSLYLSFLVLSPCIVCMMPILLITGALGGLTARALVSMLCRDIPSKRALIAALVVGGALPGLAVPWLMFAWLFQYR